MSKLFDFLKSASKAIDNVEDVVGKVSRLAEDVMGTQSQPEQVKPLRTYAELLEQYGVQPGGPGKEHQFDVFLCKPMFRADYTLPDAAAYNEEDDYGSGEIYEGYSYGDYETANMLFSVGEVGDTVTQEHVLSAYSQFYGPLTMLDYQTLSDSPFDVRAELANENIHYILYFHGHASGNLLAAECNIHKNKVDEKTSVKIMKDFEDMIASVQYSDQLLRPDLYED